MFAMLKRSKSAALCVYVCVCFFLCLTGQAIRLLWTVMSMSFCTQ